MAASECGLSDQISNASSMCPLCIHTSAKRCPRLIRLLRTVGNIGSEWSHRWMERHNDPTTTTHGNKAEIFYLKENLCLIYKSGKVRLKMCFSLYYVSTLSSGLIIEMIFPTLQTNLWHDYTANISLDKT